jgi:hypothetical protein
MSDNNPVSVRLTEEQKDKLRDIGGGSIAKGIVACLEAYQDPANQFSNDKEKDFDKVQAEINALKSSPFGFDKKIIQELEKELSKAVDEYKKTRANSIKSNILKLLKSS